MCEWLEAWPFTVKYLPIVIPFALGTVVMEAVTDRRDALLGAGTVGNLSAVAKRRQDVPAALMAIASRATRVDRAPTPRGGPKFATDKPGSTACSVAATAVASAGWTSGPITRQSWPPDAKKEPRAPAASCTTSTGMPASRRCASAAPMRSRRATRARMPGWRASSGTHGSSAGGRRQVKR